MPRHFLIALAIVVVSIGAAGCSADSTKTAEADSVVTRIDSANGLVVAPSSPYTATDAASPAALVVTLAGDSTGPATPAVRACSAVSASPETVFWVEGIRAGKPLPRQRRYDLLSAACGLEPRVQAAVVGGAVNVFNGGGTHRLLFIRAGTTDTLQTMPFTNSGAIVATDRLTKTSGVVEVRCAEHPAEKAYIAVFDHPYFGVAAAGSRVTLDSMPAGDYRLLTWHEGMPAPSTQPTKVGVNGQTEIIVR